MIEEYQAISIPPCSAWLGVEIYGGLAGQPEAVQSRKDGTKPVVCRGRDAVNPSRVGKWLAVLQRHGSGSGCQGVCKKTN